ncbi:DENN domain containing pinstripe isoform X2 [Rhipicephalus microplus]|uniref:DENN domain containing pinstripe isoform X2 n=1 Tax=Rhipicephalus microplus TaxID=6941 RepID=UPI003F6C3295
MTSLGSVFASEKRLADYFVVCGLDLESGLEPDALSGDHLHFTPLDRCYKGKVLAHYPENVSWNAFDPSAIGMLSLPHGLSFRTQKHSREPFFHPFVITREDGSRTYGQALTFYEEVTDRQICSAMQTLQAMHLTELSSNGNKAPLPRTAAIKTEAPVSRSLPRSFRLMTTSRSTDSSGGALYDITKDTLYVSKVICLVTPLPLVSACRTILQKLLSLVQGRDSPPLPLESYVYNLLYELPLPPPGRSLRLSYLYQDYVCQRPGTGELPFFDYSFRELFAILGLENCVLLFTSVCFENQILLCSEDYYRLMLVAECVTSLLLPFQWQHVYVPILPHSLHHFLDAPVPFLMGLKHVCGGEEGDAICPGEANLCLVDIDGCSVQVPEDLPSFPNKQELVAELQELLTQFGVRTPGGSSSLITSSVPNVAASATLGRSLNDRPFPRRKHSWSLESGDSGVSSTGSSARSSFTSLGTPSPLLQHSEAFQRITAVAKRAGVMNSLEDLRRPRCQDNSEGKLSLLRQPQQHASAAAADRHPQLEELRLNNAVREIFFNRFLHMFRSYDHFVIQPNQKDMEQWLASRDTVHNFDKTTFLSDQPEPHLPFLSRFIETQMFASFIDSKILSLWEEPDSCLKIFDNRIKLLRNHSNEPIINRYECCTVYKETELPIESRLSAPDLVAPVPKIVDPTVDLPGRRNHRPGVFPPLECGVLNREPVQSKVKKRAHAQFRRKDRSIQQAEHLKLTAEQREKYMNEARAKHMKQPKFSDTASAAVIAQTNWKFVEALLMECKTRTKRMLVEKMGVEAVELGHADASITGLEENTLLASFCDLLERIWSHGLQAKQGKSALWSHLLNYLEVEECRSSGKPIDRNFLTPVPVRAQVPKSFGFPEIIFSLKSGALNAVTKHLANLDLSNLVPDEMPASRGREAKERSRRVRPPDLPGLKPLPVSLLMDVKTVQAMTEVKTDIGFARAWVRLALEKKLLSKHLKKLLSNQELLRSSYKRYAFLRCEDEKEQFLYYLLTLNAVDYKCFTNTYTATVFFCVSDDTNGSSSSTLNLASLLLLRPPRRNPEMPYRVVVFPSRKLSASTTSANAWVSVSGTMGTTGVIPVPKQSLEFVCHHKNLGLLTTLRIGHDNTGLSPKWMIEHVVVRNDVTGHTYKFPCGRWLGRGIDDGSTERLLVAELVPADIDNEELMEACRTPPRCRSPSVPRRPSEPRLTIPEIQQLLGDAVNNIVKYFYKSERERGNLTILLCGELGLVYCLEQVFLYGFKDTRFFRHVYLWEYFVKVKEYFESALQDNMEEDRPNHVWRCYCHLANKVERASHTMGKDGKFQLFICLAAREHFLHQMMFDLAACPVTATMYEERSFLRDANLIVFLVQILEALSEFDIALESSITRGVDN